jgi:two-component system chemotaxis response regulator CheB
VTTVRVVVVDSSASSRARLVGVLRANDDLAVVGEVGGAIEAIDCVQAVRPDVVVLAMHEGERDAVQVVEELMVAAPVPILALVGSRRGRESEEAVAALVAGAVDVLSLPVRGDEKAEAAVRARARLVAGVAVVRRTRRRPPPVPRRAASPGDPQERGMPIVAIGASTGGPAALALVLAELGGLDASVVVVQHLHADFVDGLVAWMDRVSPLDVTTAEHGARLRRGTVHIAPAGVHLRIAGDDEMRLDPEPEMLHRPSVDVLFSSLAERPQGRTVAVLLTGMGEDGAAGMLALRRRGDVTIAQDERTSIVFGMPRAAQRLAAVVHVLPLDEIAVAIKQAMP